MTDLKQIETALAKVDKARASNLKLSGGILSLVVDMSGMDGGQRELLAADIRAALLPLDGVDDLRLIQTAEKIERRLIAVASGKGGVGKSTLSTNLALAMRLSGRPTGLVDADIYGPSQTRLLGAEGEKPEASGKTMIPVKGAGGMPFLSMGQLVKPGQPVAWRGPMAGNALSQLVDGDWGEAEELVVDMPPGTGDIQLSMIQKHRPAGAIIISTPQDLALMDAARAIGFFETAKVPIIGIVENMAGYICPNCGEVSEPFGTGGAEAAAQQLGLPFMGRIPLDISIRKASDDGLPPALNEGPIADAFGAIARQVSNWLDNNKAGG